MTTQAIHNTQDTTTAGTLFLAFELSEKTWKLGFTTGHGQKPRERTMTARQPERVLDEIAQAKRRLSLPETAPVVSCYEAGREGFWLHRFLQGQGITNHVVDSSSIEVNRRRRRAKSDGLDVRKLVTMLMRYHYGEQQVWQVVHVPSVEAEDQRHLHRDLETLKRERASTMTRIKRTLHGSPVLSPLPPPSWRFYERHHPHSLWHGDFLEKVTLSDLQQTAYQLTLLDDYSRGYVFCDLYLNPDARTTIRALIAAMRQWQVIPGAVLFDHGSAFTGRLLTAFCQQVGIRLIHIALHHPQTNGKMERAFRDDMRDFYQQHTPWLLEPLRQALPAYIHYRNYVRGHRALQGQPAITRLREHTRLADATLLAQLEHYAAYEMRHKVIPATGCIRLFGREAHVGATWANQAVVFWESLAGLEVRHQGQCVAVLRDYRTFRQMLPYRADQIPSVLYFEPCERDICPRNAVA